MITHNDGDNTQRKTKSKDSKDSSYLQYCKSLNCCYIYIIYVTFD